MSNQLNGQFSVDSSEENGTLFTNDQQNEVSVTFTASGTWNTGSGSKIDYGAEGKSGAKSKNAPYPDNTLYALLAVNSNNDVVGEGASMSLTLEANESVRFVVNDTHYANNSGQLTVDWQTNASAARQLNTKQRSGTMGLSIHPSVGVARLGNSGDLELPTPGPRIFEQDFFFAPEAIGGLPFEADVDGNKTDIPVTRFKDHAGRIKRQGQLFRVFDDSGYELTLDSPNVQSIEWTVHLANKKAAWYDYSELQGNLLYGPDNSYSNRGVDLRNKSKETLEERQELIIDPGPRTVSGANEQVSFDQDTTPEPATYPVQYPPQKVEHGIPIKTLGELRTDSNGRLIVLGGYGHAGGNEPLTSYGGSDTWHDDISDGPVYCTVTFKERIAPVTVKAWVIVGSPDFAPELVNISNLSDSMFDVGVRHFNLIPDMYDQTNGWNQDYIANYERDILPILERMSRYQWVANVQAMTALTLALNTFDPKNNTDTSPTNPRAKFFEYFRGLNGKPQEGTLPQGALFKSQKENGGVETPVYDFPMMPLNSGSNSVSNDNIVKLLALNETQYFLLGQWAKGKFNNINLLIYRPDPVHPLDTASVGNCVGLPMCPGIEVTWSVQNPAIYESPYVIQHHKEKGGYDVDGLDPDRDECEGEGCEPGDLTKRMACPWQADFFQCTIQYVNFTDPETNKVPDPLPDDPDNMKPKPPTYYAYWWPPQSPWDVLTGETSEEGQAVSHSPAGMQVNYARGINNFVQMVEHWDALGFIRDQNAGQAGYPYFVETERTHELFSYKEARVASYSDNQDDWEATIPVFFIDKDRESVGGKSKRGAKLVERLEKRAFKAIKVAPGAHRMPRSGTRMRR